MDEVTQYNQARWEALVSAQALFTRPWLDLDPRSARARLDPENGLGDVRGKAVLCLASGGGQQSAAFALLDAKVTMVDLCAGQLAQDRKAARHYGLQIATHQGDMRDLSFLAASSFDIVWHPYALNFVPDCRVVFDQVARVIRPSGLYYLMAANPFLCGLGTQNWNGHAYELKRPYVDGAEVIYPDEGWVYDQDRSGAGILPPREYRQSLSRLLNGLVARGFILVKLKEWAAEHPPLDAAPGSWDHFRLYAPPWFRLWTLYRPELGLGV